MGIEGFQISGQGPTTRILETCSLNLRVFPWALATGSYLVLPLSAPWTPGAFVEVLDHWVHVSCLKTVSIRGLYYTILYYTILYYTILYYTILYYTILYYTISYTILYHILYYTILYYTILYYTILYYTILYYTILYYTILNTILYYTILYYTILYYTIRSNLKSSG